MEIRREWRWGIAVITDAGMVEGPEVPTDGRLVAVSPPWLIIRVRHAADSDEQPDGSWPPATVTLHVQTPDRPDLESREMLGSFVIESPSRQLSIGDAESDSRIVVRASRTRVQVSAEVADPFGLAEAWISLSPVEGE